MKLSMLDQSFGEILRAEFLIAQAAPDPSAWRDRQLRIQRLDDGRLEARNSKGQQALLQPDGRKADRFLDRIVDGGADALVWAIDASASRIVLHAHLLRDLRPIPQGLTIALGAHGPEDLKRFGLSGSNLASAVGEEMALCQSDGERLGFLVSLPTRPEEDRFVVHGPRFNLEVRRKSDQPVVFRVVGANQKRPALTWLAGPVRFVDGDSVNPTHESTHAQLLAISRSGTYLAGWRKYNDIERRLVVEKAEKRGVVRYAGSPQLQTRGERKLLVFHLAEALPEPLAQLAEQSDARLGILDRVAIEASGMSAAHYFKHWALSREEREAVSPVRTRLLEGRGIGKLVMIPSSEDLLAIEVKGYVPVAEIPSDGWLAIDLKGETVRLDRREAAMGMVEDRRARVSRLGEMLEGLPPGYGKGRRRTVGKIDTQAVLEAMQQATLNDAQRRAIETALRTPDLALILGPPGTGKTAVIRAIVRKLGELDSELGIRTRILLSAFQHDAVDEVLRDVTLCGMSGFRIGGPSGDGTGSAQELRLTQAEAWAAPCIRKARLSAAKLPEEPVAQAHRTACERFLAWRTDPRGPVGTREAIAELEDLLRPYVDDKAMAGLAAAWKRQDVQARAARRLDLAPEDQQRLIERLAGLRVEQNSFADDGPRQAGRLLDFLNAAGVDTTPAQRQILEVARATRPGQSAAVTVLEGLADLQRELRRATGVEPQQPGAAAIDPQAEAAMRAALNQAARRVTSSTEGARQALEDFARALNVDLEGLAATMERYAQALGATCQQSVRAGVDSEPELADHDIVIIDEAARANPLDLLIPMVRGERVILVGDPNQLPHVLEKQVEDELEQDGNAQAKELLGESLFERLWKLCERWQAEDGIPRTVQLDEQYRMHPTLGSFVSRTFYERRERDEAPDKRRTVENGIKDPSLRQHKFSSFAGRIAAWVDVPWHKGKEQQLTGSTSRVRNAEVEELKQAVAQLRFEDPSASIGVITFYKDQALRLARALGVGLGEGDQLRVGTVDAFQGRQFDAVILSTVRANELRRPGEESRRSRIGFLALRNRLCVAMSRARRLLIVVGCKETTAGIAAPDQPADSAVPDSACWQLTRFYEELCGGQPFTFQARSR